MAYSKPGVIVTQEQVSASPNLAAPSLTAAIIGVGYHVAELDDYEYNASYDNTSGNTVTLSGITNNMTIDGGSVYVDILSARGGRYHLADSEYSVNTNNNEVTISGSINSDYDSGTIQMGYRARWTNINEYKEYNSQEDITKKVGTRKSYNPLAYGLSLAMSNAGTAIGGYGVPEDTNAEHDTARSDLALEEVYAMAPMTHQDVQSEYTSHVTTQSLPENKKERIVFVNEPTDWYDAGGSTVTGPTDASMDKAETAGQIADTAFSIQNKRTFYTFSDTFYVTETRDVATVKQSYISLVHTNASTYDLYAKFTEPVVLNGTQYYPGDDITDTVYGDIRQYWETQTITVLVPVPGYYAGAMAAGQVAGLAPEQPFTNLATAGLSRVKYAGEFFSESQLDTIAGGGVYVFWQANQSAAIVSRHQLSTDRRTIESQELSITKSVDFVAKFLRGALRPFIGSRNITPKFINMIRSLLTGARIFLIEADYINDLQVEKVEQDPNQKDTVNIVVNISTKYPANYIKVTLKY